MGRKESIMCQINKGMKIVSRFWGAGAQLMCSVMIYRNEKRYCAFELRIRITGLTFDTAFTAACFRFLMETHIELL